MKNVNQRKSDVRHKDILVQSEVDKCSGTPKGPIVTAWEPTPELHQAEKARTKCHPLALAKTDRHSRLAVVPTRTVGAEDPENYGEKVVIKLVDEETEERTDEQEKWKNIEIPPPPRGNFYANTLMAEDSGLWCGEKCGRRQSR